jgi:hypothetical protein
MALAMLPDVKSVRYLRDYKLELTFTDGVCGRIDFAPWILGQGGVFLPLEEKAFFSKVAVNSELGTIVWPNDVDIDPEVLYSHITGKPIPDSATNVAS